MYDDDIVGRARVTDNEELRLFYEELKPLKTGALWTVANKIEPWFPQSKSIPTIWRYSDMRPAVMKAARLVSTEDAARRVVMLLNPGREDVTATVGWIYSGIQIMLPGEWTTAHSHAAAALRFVMEGKGAYTVVDGERLHVGPRDFLITPSGTWHDHGNDGDTEPVIWQDGLDLPLVNALEANFYAVYDESRQTGGAVTNPSYLTYGVAGLMPVAREWKHPFSPLSYFPWDRTYEALSNYAKVYDGSPWDDIIMEYVNPLNAGSVLPTMGASMQMLRPGVATRAHRHTGSSVYHVAKGSGYSVINGQRFDWKEKDVFCVPSWALHEHANASDTEDACLFSFNDFPVMQKLGLWREEEYLENGGKQVVIPGVY